MENVLNINQEGINPLDGMAVDVQDLSYADQPTDYSEMVEEDIFLGDTPYDVIIEGITNQFNDYINISDPTNYVDIFYNQLNASYESINSDEEEDHPIEKIEALDRIYEKFLNEINDLFKLRLTLVIIDLDDGEISSSDKDELEFIIRRLYEFFILDARNNFKVAISSDILHKANNFMSDSDVEYFKKINTLLDTNYTPLIRGMSPKEFIEYQGDNEIIDLFEDGKVSGNFLRKYSPKLYQNEEFRVELINYITMIQQFKDDVLSGESK